MNSEITAPNMHRQYRSTHDGCVINGGLCANNAQDVCIKDSYSGEKSTTVNGNTCQIWKSQSPHEHGNKGTHYGNTNFCRNPDLGPGPWCYTTDNNTRWELCFETCSGSMYQISSTFESWNSAKKTCEDNGMVLAMVKSTLQKCFLHDAIRSHGMVSIGLSDESKEGDFTWVDGSSYKTNRTMQWGRAWNGPEPNGGRRENCVVTGYLETDMIYDFECDQQFKFACQRTSFYMPSSGSPCPDTWKYFFDNKTGATCFKLIVNKKSWSDALDYCQKLGASLPVIRSAEEHNFFLNYVYDILNGSSRTVSFWLGGSDKDHEGHFSWLDGTPVSPIITPWYPGEPNGNIRENCLDLFQHRSRIGINDAPCYVKFDFFCQKQAGPVYQQYDPVCGYGENDTDGCKYCLIGQHTSKSVPLYSTYTAGTKDKPYKLNNSLATCPFAAWVLKNGVKNIYIASYKKDTAMKTICDVGASKLILNRRTTDGKTEETEIDAQLSEDTAMIQLHLQCNGGSLSAEVDFLSPQMQKKSQMEINGDIFSIECI